MDKVSFESGVEDRRSGVCSESGDEDDKLM